MHLLHLVVKAVELQMLLTQNATIFSFMMMFKICKIDTNKMINATGLFHDTLWCPSFWGEHYPLIMHEDPSNFNNAILQSASAY